MSKLTIGLVAGGAALATAAALSVFAGNGAVSAGHDSAQGTGAAVVPSISSALRGGAVSDDTAVDSLSASGDAQRVTQASVRVVKPVRSVVLVLPKLPTEVGANVTGSISVVDTAGKVVTPVEGAAVAFQQKRGTKYVTLSDGLTDANGQFGVAFTSKVNYTWRAELSASTGKKYSRTVVSIASASVNWAARPDMDVTHGVATSYAFRINSTVPVSGTAAKPAVAKANLQIASSKTPTKWVSLKAVSVPTTGVVSQSQKFPSAGTWFLRGATAANATNGAGYTSTLTIKVS
jgi:hypothetical protein